MEYIIEEINKKIEELKSKTIKDSDELTFFEKNIKFNKSNLISINNISRAYFLLACIRLTNNKESFEIDKKSIEYLKEDLDSIDSEKMSEVLDGLIDLDNENAINEITSYMPNMKKIESLGLEGSYQIAKDGLKKLFNNPNKYKEFLNLFKKYKDTDVFEQFLHFDSCVNAVNRDIIKEYISKGVSSRKKGKANSVLLNAVSIFGEVTELFDDIFNYTNSLRLSIKKEKNKTNKEYILYENLLTILKTSKFVLTKNMIDFIDDESFKQDIILAILSKNNKEYQLLVDDYNKNKNTEINELDKILSDYGIIISNNSNKMLLLENVNIDDIKNSIKALNSSLLTFIKSEEERFVKIFLLSDPNIISSINNLYTNNILTLDFIKDNIGLFISNSKNFAEKEKEIMEHSEIEPLYDKLNSNIEILSNKNICLSNIKKYDINFLLKDTNDLIDNIGIINTYNIDLSDTNLINFYIIDNIKQLDIVDGFIEQGMFEYLTSHVELINSDISVIKKIVLAKYLDIPIFDSNNTIKNEIIEKNKFYISDTKLDDYIDNSSLSHLNPDCYITLSENKNSLISNEILYNELILNLEKSNKISNNEYSFDGIIISRNKVLRNMTTLKNKINKEDISDKDLLINSILYNTILPEESIQIILNKVDSIDSNKILKKN